MREFTARERRRDELETLRLTVAQRRALETICATFCPDDPSSRDVGVADALLELTPASDRRALFALLSLWDVGHRFSRRPRERREAMLRAWRDSSLAFRRRVFHGLRRGSLIPYYATLGVDGYRLPELPPPAPRRISIEDIGGDTRLDCDVCVVGSGAGGGVAAADREDRLIGELSAFGRENRPAEIGMTVAAEWRGHGVGTALMQACVAWARERGIHKLSLQVWPHNTVALHLYERFGFEHEGVLRSHYRRQNGEFWDAIVMGLLL
jgi:GNAT superfamily N-acetyltransferase